MVRWWSVAVVLCVAACSAVDDLPWWKTASLYHVYPRSFKDSDGDGVGDLKGITQMAGYFKEIGLTAIWLSPIYPSPKVDFGYDISDFTDVDPVFGTMDDFDALAKEMKRVGIKLLLDFVPNHTSDQHPWFQKSLANDPDYRDFYVWQDAKEWRNGTPVPPNNWISIFGGSMWEWREERQQFYLHQFHKQQPDLNYRCENVLANMTAVLQFWMDKGVDGFRVDALKFVYENASFPDTQAVPGTAGNTTGTQLHNYMENQPETFELNEYWGNVLYQRSQLDNEERPFFLEIYDTHETLMKYYGTGNLSFVIPFNFDMVTEASTVMQAPVLKDIIESWLTVMPEDQVPNWVTGNHDNHRTANAYGKEMVDAINMLTGTLSGIKTTYYGEEIGMQDTFVREDEEYDRNNPTTDFNSRDPCRTPLQWDDSLSAGFSTNSTTWLPVNPNYWWLNVDAQRKAESSHLKVFQAMMAARQDPVLQRGDVTILAPDTDTFLVVRYYNDSYYILLINLGNKISTYTSESLFTPNKMDMNMRVVVGSMNSGYTAGTCLKQGAISIALRPKAAVLLASSAILHILSMTALLLLILTALVA